MMLQASYADSAEGITKYLESNPNFFRDLMISISTQYYEYDKNNLNTHQTQKLKNIMTCLLMYCHINDNFRLFPKAIKNAVITKDIILNMKINESKITDYKCVVPSIFIEQFNEFKKEICGNFKEDLIPVLNLTFRLETFRAAVIKTFIKFSH